MVLLSVVRACRRSDGRKQSAAWQRARVCATSRWRRPRWVGLRVRCACGVLARASAASARLRAPAPASAAGSACSAAAAAVLQNADRGWWGLGRKARHNSAKLRQPDAQHADDADEDTTKSEVRASRKKRKQQSTGRNQRARGADYFRGARK